MARRLATSDRACAARIVAKAKRRCSGEKLVPFRSQMVLVAALIMQLVALLEAASAQSVSADAISQSRFGNEAREALGDGVVGAPRPAWPLSDLTRNALWAPGGWWYLITAGYRRGRLVRDRECEAVG